MSDDDLNARRAAALAGDKCFSQSAKWRLNRSKFGIPADHDLAHYGSLSYDCSWIFSLRDDKYPDMGGLRLPDAIISKKIMENWMLKPYR
ncbi:hypothetical protein D4T05_25555 [Salmonella enterica]|nr:hypothetical protein [Salmonella enterica]EAB6034409.1 hypothetical protein [Salmonella enterica subsp. enterica serovar Java]ECJ4483681.1 hypothetical protein [Salmonella enterica subsp. diarizonae]ECT8549896.1 hypothetical protein [Salmonella enterica subsp. diarizonae serovar 48:i:z]EAP0945720.1 hypothetical protein [Salmonella enterica]